MFLPLNLITKMGVYSKTTIQSCLKPFAEKKWLRLYFNEIQITPIACLNVKVAIKHLFINYVAKW